MGKLTAKQVIAYSKADPKKYSDGEGLYFCVRKQGSPYWMIRYTTAKGRREATLGQFPLMSLADARIAAAYFRKEVRDGIDPLLEKQKIELPDIETVDQLFHDWYRTDLSRRLKHPKIPYRVYTKDISPVIGIKGIAEVTARDVREVLERIRDYHCQRYLDVHEAAVSTCDKARLNAEQPSRSIYRGRCRWRGVQ